MIVSDNVDFVLRFKDKHCDVTPKADHASDNCRHICASDNECKYFSQWADPRELGLTGAPWCQTYKSCTNQIPDTNSRCKPENADACPLKTFEKIGTFLNCLVNVVLLIFFNIDIYDKYI